MAKKFNLPTPEEVIAQEQINWVKADNYNKDFEQISSFFINGILPIAGSMVQNPEFMKSFAAFGLENAGMGKPVEAEGGEVLETPDGMATELQGPKHEQGGIDTVVPKGSDIYSDRLKIDGETIAERKKKRLKEIEKIQKKLSKNPDDEILKSTLRRLVEIDKKESEKELQMQEEFKAKLESQQQQPLQQEELPKMALGDTNIGGNPFSLFTDDFVKYLNALAKNGGKDNPLQPIDKPDLPYAKIGGNIGEDSLPSNFYVHESTNEAGRKNGFNLDFVSKLKPGMSFGDIAGLLAQGQMVSKIGEATKNNRATDQPHTNLYTNLEDEAINKLETTKDAIKQNTDSYLKNSTSQANALRSRLRKTSRGIGSLRAGDIGAYDREMDVKEKAVLHMLSQLAGIDSREAGLLFQGDRLEAMGAEKARNLNDADRDNYYTNVAKDTMNKLWGIQNIAKNFNDIKERNVNAKWLNDTNKYVNQDVITGETTAKEGAYDKVENNYLSDNNIDSVIINSGYVDLKNWMNMSEREKNVYRALFKQLNIQGKSKKQTKKQKR